MVDSVRPVSLSAVAAALEAHGGGAAHGADTLVSDVYMDSRLVTPGSLYVAIRGARADGHRFVAGAVERGAVAVVVEEPPNSDVPYLLVADSRAALGWAAAAVYRNPASGLGLVGVTGTNGKTTVAHMMAAMAPGSDRTMAVIGTVSANLDDADVSPRTTPEADRLQRVLRHLADGGRISDVAIEVSSHAMEMGRVNGTTFDVVAFTNLSQDHLDYHQTMEQYFAAKSKLFGQGWAPHGVVWTDDDWGRRLATESSIPVFTVGTDPTADAVVSYGTDTPEGSTFTMTLDGQKVLVRTALAGRFNVANAAIALMCAHLQGWDVARSVAKLAQMDPIRGRYNTIANTRGIWIVVDYAHTPDAISSVIGETRGLVTGRVIALAGAGGDRDREKRPLMGRALTDADVAIITTDNPRSEDPDAIQEQVLSGVPAHRGVTVEPDRRIAIRRALTIAEPGDAVLILGKGHETGQEFAAGVLPFDDADVASQELATLGGQP
jgi:UDP-N-acetylmuramoyl-L-alanyl-D-glutamate--2,6-diaminopimelate ligase